MKSFLFSISLLAASHAVAVPASLFDGKTLAGWEAPKNEEKWWSVQDGTITGGSLTQKVPGNLFLASEKDYQNFELKFTIRLVKGAGFNNSGMQVRSLREGATMTGYQVDAGVGYWGDLYDEHRRNRKIAGAVDMPALKAAVKDWEWNEYRIVCEGPRIRSWINGVPALDFTEKDKAIAMDGKLGIQMHSGGTLLVQVKDITIDAFPDTPGAPTWESNKSAAPAKPTANSGALSPAEELQKFKLPPGFVAELVASEEQGVGKPITMAWDARGRFWTMTAFEYPVDGNENRAAAEALYARGGKDKVLVFDNPAGPLPLKPRVFADGLAIPLGILPDPKGETVLVHNGSQIRRYKDTDGDGKADKFDVILDGFGIQDSHLMPHQFEYAPGGWIYVAQGLFNNSKVFRPNHKPFANGATEVTYNQCKLARFRPDGSEFEIVTQGPNNIWGFTEGRTGYTYLQEANDMGIPAAEFEAGAHYPTGSAEKLRPYAPRIPSSISPPAMGGTGLSGLALADDKETIFAKHYGGDEVFYVANPITNRIQVITTTRKDDEHPAYTKREDFLVSSDVRFRPVSVHFGPDGFLYIADWYNKIISHNEVPRDHPDRDKTHGRIWRIRPAQAPAVPPVDLPSMQDKQLVAELDGTHSRVSAMAVALLSERKAGDLSDLLENVVIDSKESSARRVAALRVLEAARQLPNNVLANLATDSVPELRYEAVRAAIELKMPPAEFVAAFGKLPDDANYRVRAGFANAVRRHPQADVAMIELVARLGRTPLAEGKTWEVYDRRFERYLARWAMETHRAATETLLAKGGMHDVEARLLAIQALEPVKAAILLVREVPALPRPLTSDELALLGGQLSQPQVLQGMDELLADPMKRKPVLESLSRLQPSMLANPALASLVNKACGSLLAQGNAPEDRSLVIKLVKLMRLKEFEPVVAGWLKADAPPVELTAMLDALRETGSKRLDLFVEYVGHADSEVSRSAVSALAFANDTQVVAKLGEQWANLPGALRSIATDGMTSSREKAEAFAQLATTGTFGTPDGTVFEKLIVLLGVENPAMSELLKKNESVIGRVIRMPGKPDAKVGDPINLQGAFTVETWIRLDPGIGNQDSLLGARSGADFNFYGQQLRVHAPQGGDVIVSNRKVEPDTWIHCAITRDTGGNFRIYFDGELDKDKGMVFAGPMTGLSLGATSTGNITAARYTEFRVWDIARSEEEIRANYRTNLAGQKVDHLVQRISSDAVPNLKSPASVEMTLDFPRLVTAAQATESAAKFARYRAITDNAGDPAAGRAIFQGTCMMCHQVKGEGMQIGPDLTGAGAMGRESLLRNVLDPNAQLESGYYRHDVTLKDGSMISGFMVEETKEALTLRPIGAEPKVIPRDMITKHDISKRSLMPEGLVGGMNDKQVNDLFTYLMTLK